MKAWLTRVGKFRVEHVPLPYWHGNVDMSAPRKGILHTTEGSSIEGALSAYRSKNFTPTFTLGRDFHKKVRVMQHKPLGIMGSTLANASGGVETNRVALIQIELVGFSKKDLWYPDAEVADALTSLIAAVSTEGNVPLRWNACKRSSSCWRNVAGWMGHIDVPENFHWDPGQMDTKRLMAQSSAKAAEGDAPKSSKRPRLMDTVTTIPVKRRAKKTPPTSCHHDHSAAGGSGRVAA